MDNWLSCRRRPARQTSEKTSCVSTGQAGPVLCTRHTSFLSRQRDVIASFSFGACIVYTNVMSESYFWNFHLYSSECAFCIILLYSRVLTDHFDFGFCYGSASLPLVRSMEVVDISWLASTAIVPARCREKGKGSDRCVSKNDCNSCNILSEDQRLQLSTPSYRLKKEKRDLKKSADTPKQDSTSSSLIDPSSVTVVGVVDDQGILQSPGSSSGKKMKSNTPEKSKAHSSKDTKTVSDKPSKSLATKTHRSSRDTRIEELKRFNRLEALLLARSLDREPTFATVKVTPAHSPPHSSVISSKPFIKPSHDTESLATDLASQRPVTDQPQESLTAQQSSDLHGNFQTVSKSTSKSSRAKVSADRHSDMAGTDSSLSQQVPSRSSSAPARRNSASSMDSNSDTDLSDRPPVDIFVEEGELSEQDPEASVNDPDLTLSEEQNYCESMSGIRSFMGWNHIPEIDTATSKSEDNPFAGPKVQPTGKVSVTMPTDEWLCNKMGKLNLTLTEGYPSRSTEAGGLLKDQFVRPPKKSQSKWYNFVPNPHKGDQETAQTVNTWSTDASKVNSSYSRIAKAAGINSTCFASNFPGQSKKVGEISPRSLYHLQPSGWFQQMLI